MKTLIFASNNKHKLEEIRNLLEGIVEIKSLKEIGLEGDIPETADTLEGNATQKAEWVYSRTGMDCFADDSGLQVDALGGEPGVFSARYAANCGKAVGNNKDEANMDALLEKLAAIAPRQIGEGPLAGTEGWDACFRTSIALIYEGCEYYFDGTVSGHIISEKRGDGGFGYDPIFVPEGYGETFAELGAEVKNGISHRARAVGKLAEFLGV